MWETTDILLTPEKGMEARWEKLRDLRVAQDKGTHKKAVVWAMPRTISELRHLGGARVEGCSTHNQQDIHPASDASPSPTAKAPHKPSSTHHHWQQQHLQQN